ncbi:MAG: hypothetical protein QOF85_706 [Solirubrobacterales bacterium]|jgi:hypothetical protein|nr:hypothetical protein [Solirubrobacterales bacterium]
MSRRTRLVLQLLAALALGTLALTVSACGYSSDSKSVVEGEVVKLGELKYQVVFSRFLNINDNEDSAYLAGQPTPKKGSAYFGVFLEVQNKSEGTQKLADSFVITDAGGQPFEAIPSESLYAFPLGGEVESQEPIPAPDSTPQQGPIEGTLVLFELPASASENRPLTLSIAGPEGPAEVTLDL